MSATSTTPSEPPQGPEGFWHDCVLWAHQPRDGVIVPMTVAAEIAREVMCDAMNELPPRATAIEISAFLQRHGRQRALQRVAAERAAKNDSQLWHDANWQPDEPLMDLRGLRLHENAAWSAAMPVLRALAMPVIHGAGVAEAEDVFSEVLAALIGPLQGLLVAEQLPPLVKTIARRRAVDHVRHLSALKRDAILVSDDQEAADAACAMEFDLQDVWDHCARLLTAAQWEIIDRLILRSTDTHTSLIADARLMSALHIDPRSSEATRRRRLRDSLDEALLHIRRHLLDPS
ncbi:MAG: sigma-70 family RNA polymerase sigma factor [Prosthecobacter sp.]|jgi:DNA-directed RNA polymerase specialized sigma24 family protein|uniref:hypothetical protein n=1 Tax=Prosthecobacter sp. TaxID=1965333 RepID=UPI0019FC10F1|nr:hypothetical protein [Prosthecobacter sp.]MBE2284959.1 sigma-70 family RNA polymerase sigma factor [Prosthecobacter sp.]